MTAQTALSRANGSGVDRSLRRRRFRPITTVMKKLRALWPLGLGRSAEDAR